MDSQTQMIVIRIEGVLSCESAVERMLCCVGYPVTFDDMHVQTIEEGSKGQRYEHTRPICTWNYRSLQTRLRTAALEHIFLSTDHLCFLMPK